MEHIRHLAEQLLSTVQDAGRLEMQIYEQDFSVEQKSDNSPVTEADRLAEAVILETLARISPDIPVIAEEAASEGNIPETGDRFFLVDPLDGTREFIKKSHEFTVNIALVDKGQPVFGIVYAPAIKKLYLTLGPDKAMSTRLDPFEPVKTLDELDLKSISTRTPASKGLVVVASKSHMTDETRDFIKKSKVSELHSIGSSLKFCLLACGDADLYPRFGPTMEWDTAAGHAILKAAGGEVVTIDGLPLRYGKKDRKYLNPFFIGWARNPLSSSPY